MAAFLEDIDRNGAGTNILHLIGHGTVRGKVLGSARRAPTAEELERMKALVDQAMRDGAWGMSTGLIYPPSSFAEADEITALAKVVAAHGGIYATHIRGERATMSSKRWRESDPDWVSPACPSTSHFNRCRFPTGAKFQAAHRRAGWLGITADQYPTPVPSRSWMLPCRSRRSVVQTPNWRAVRGRICRLRRVVADQLGRTKIVTARLSSYAGRASKVADDEKIEAGTWY